MRSPPLLPIPDRHAVPAGDDDVAAVGQNANHPHRLALWNDDGISNLVDGPDSNVAVWRAGLLFAGVAAPGDERFAVRRKCEVVHRRRVRQRSLLERSLTQVPAPKGVPRQHGQRTRRFEPEELLHVGEARHLAVALDVQTCAIPLGMRTATNAPESLHRMESGGSSVRKRVSCDPVAMSTTRTTPARLTSAR